MRQYELIDSVTSYKPDADQKLLEKAYIYGTKMHGRQLRASGDPYFSHPIEVAGILAELKLDTTTVVCALLHRVERSAPHVVQAYQNETTRQSTVNKQIVWQ